MDKACLTEHLTGNQPGAVFGKLHFEVGARASDGGVPENQSLFRQLVLRNDHVGREQASIWRQVSG